MIISEIKKIEKVGEYFIELLNEQKVIKDELKGEYKSEKKATKL